jgi:hypothetical protein
MLQVVLAYVAVFAMSLVAFLDARFLVSMQRAEPLCHRLTCVFVCTAVLWQMDFMATCKQVIIAFVYDRWAVMEDCCCIPTCVMTQ